MTARGSDVLDAFAAFAVAHRAEEDEWLCVTLRQTPDRRARSSRQRFLAAAPSAERMGYPPRSSRRRRQRLAKALERGTLVMFGATRRRARPPLPPGQRLLLPDRQRSAERRARHGRAGRPVAPLPAEAERDGDPLRRAATGSRSRTRPRSTASRPSSRCPALHEFLARRRGCPGPRRCGRGCPSGTTVNHGRIDAAIRTARRLDNPFAQHPTEDAAARRAAARACSPTTRCRT